MKSGGVYICTDTLDDKHGEQCVITLVGEYEVTVMYDGDASEFTWDRDDFANSHMSADAPEGAQDLKEALAYLFRSGAIKIPVDLGRTYDGLMNRVSVTIDSEEVYTSEHSAYL